MSNLNPPLPPRLPLRPPQPPETQARWPVRRMVTLVLAALLLVTVGLAWRSGHENEPAAPLSVLDGLPKTPAEVQAWYTDPPTDQNAALVYQQGFAALQLQNANRPGVPLFGQAQIPAPDAPLPVPVRTELAWLVQANQPALQWFRRGAELNRSRYEVDLSQSYETVFLHLNPLKKAYGITELAALFHADSHQAQEAGSDLRSILGLADSLRSEPALISQLARILGIYRAFLGLEQVLNRTSLPAETLTQLGDALRRMETVESGGEPFSRALVGERADALGLFDQPAGLLPFVAAPGTKITGSERQNLNDRIQRGDSFRRERQFYDQTLARMLAARKSALPHRLQSDKISYEAIQAANRKGLTAARLTLVGLTGRALQEAECLAELRIALTAVALEQYHAARSSYPDRLEALVPEYLPNVLMDPFQAQPLGYQKNGHGYVLTSLGPDGFAGYGKRERSRTGDLAFRITNRPL